MLVTTADRAHRMIDALPEQQRTVLHLRLVRGLSVAHTARILGSDPAAVLRVQHDALNALRRHLQRR